MADFSRPIDANWIVEFQTGDRYLVSYRKRGSRLIPKRTVLYSEATWFTQSSADEAAIALSREFKCSARYVRPDDYDLYSKSSRLEEAFKARPEYPDVEAILQALLDMNYNNHPLDKLTLDEWRALRIKICGRPGHAE